MSVSYHKNGLLSSHQSIGRCFFVLCSKKFDGKKFAINSLRVSVKIEFVVGTISLSCELH